jgi:hypothetical protein
MTAYNVVRFRVKAGREKEFEDAHRNAKLEATGFRKGSLIKTGERTYCFIGEWGSQDNVAAARPKMIATLRPLVERPGLRSDRLRDAASGPA